MEHIKLNNKGCQYCQGKIPVRGENDLLTLEPELCRDWDEENELKPYEVTKHSNKKVIWKCQFCKYRWIAMINSRTGVNKTRCPNCNTTIVKDSDIAGPDDF